MKMNDFFVALHFEFSQRKERNDQNQMRILFSITKEKIKNLIPVVYFVNYFGVKNQNFYLIF